MSEGDKETGFTGRPEFTITDIVVSPAPCNKCSIGKTYYNLYEFKVNGGAQNTVAILKK